jgi:hypothetical protein
MNLDSPVLQVGIELQKKFLSHYISLQNSEPLQSGLAEPESAKLNYMYKNQEHNHLLPWSETSL